MPWLHLQQSWLRCDSLEFERRQGATCATRRWANVRDWRPSEARAASLLVPRRGEAGECTLAWRGGVSSSSPSCHSS